MRAIISTITILAALTTLATDQDEKRSASAERTAERMRKQIRTELKTLPEHAWAGEYYAGDGLGVNTTLSISPKAGFVFEWHGCMGLYDRNYGVVTWTKDRLVLSFRLNNERKGFQGLATELIPVSWGERRYLIPSDDMVGFCNRFNDGGEPRTGMHGIYLMRNGDENKPATGSPNLPKEFQPYLLSKTIVAQVVSVGPYKTRPSVASWKFKDTPVVLNAGANQGLRIGMELLVTEPSKVVESVRITKVDEKQSEGVFSQIGEEEPGPKIGWRVSTRAPWSDLRKSR